ncbi:uncharacterized protein EI97DRAFT_223332 [Westerdykella ornata]|uniref:Peptidase S28 n=1 Tax=Westerdykella ornata TaxID=318751 RepID=A0A6A6JQL4_WESOR|nr:uncharacterized protein EI97DRAFT_223332 [Westerdykella ornata]KAF2278921.1 hypothetical protein EI97DRAFT_223332 [Westerdykella ornata]
MRRGILCGLLALFGSASAIRFGHPSVGELRELAKTTQHASAKRDLRKRDDADLELLYPAHNLSVPIDFFPNKPRYEPHSNGTFNLRYWFDATHYKPGGPVFVLLSGETDGVGRLPYLQKGIVSIVAKATNGLGVVLEHRYYGTSFPVDDLSVKNLRFLSTEQALAEINYFARHVKFPGIDADLTAPNTPWIVYGGSYAGAQAAFLRVAYPETFWGAISSSGVTVAIYDYWEYFEPVRQFAPPDVVKNTQFLVDVVDTILLKSKNSAKVKELKEAFGLGNITDNRDFANVLANGIYGWQNTNWDPEVNSPAFWYYQNNLTTALQNPATESLRPKVQSILAAASYPPSTASENILLNAINYFDVAYVSRWRSTNQTQDQFFTWLDDSFWANDGIDQQGWRSWMWQVCTEWGYIQTGNTPPHIKPLISRAIDLEYAAYPCRPAFNITSPPNVTEVNKYGGYDIEYERLAIIGGNADPWKPATPLADKARRRRSTTEKPVLEIAHGVHHWEENGVFDNQTSPILPPNQVVYAQQFVRDFVVEWLKDWDKKHSHHEL